MTKQERAEQLKSELIELRDNVAEMDAKSIEEAEAKSAEYSQICEEIKRADDLKAKLNSIGSVENVKADDEEAKSFGEYAVKYFKSANRDGKFSVSTPEYKANTDVSVEGNTFDTGLTDVKKEIIPLYQRPMVCDVLFNHETIAGKSVEYYLGNEFEGTPASVLEGGLKPQIHMPAPTKQTDSLKKIASFTKISDEMLEDVPYMVSYINNRAIYLHNIQKEAQVLKGNGTDPNILGLVNRSGVQSAVVASTDWAKGDSLADAIFDAKMDVMQNSGFLADGIIINPEDYKIIRKGKDSTGQYYGGGYITGAYGASQLPQFVENVWGIPTFVSPAVNSGEIIVGAFKLGASIFNKQGAGLRVEFANQNEDDFKYNRVSVRIEERLGLAVYYPKAFKVLKKSSSADGDRKIR